MFTNPLKDIDVLYHVSKKGTVKTAPILIIQAKHADYLPYIERLCNMFHGAYKTNDMGDWKTGIHRIVLRGRHKRSWHILSKMKIKRVKNVQ